MALSAQGAGALFAQDPVQATDANHAAFLTTDGRGWVVRRADAAPVEVALSPRLVPYRFEELVEGWLVTGTVADGARTELSIERIGDGTTASLPVPPDRFGRQRANPVPFIENGLLRGLAWIEGDRHDATTVVGAEWLGDRWGPVEAISPRGPGTQIALSGTVTENGAWVAVWSGFDGEDDEILWSRQGGEGWTPPRRVHEDNTVPDITPSVIATGSGALVAWSVYDGEDYRLRLARLQGDTWSLESLSGARGSLYPRTLRADDRIFVLHSTVAPQGWSIVELDARGARIRLLHAGAPTAERPVVVPRWGDAPELVWPIGGDGPRRLVPIPVPPPRSSAEDR